MTNARKIYNNWNTIFFFIRFYLRRFGKKIKNTKYKMGAFIRRTRSQTCEQLCDLASFESIAILQWNKQFHMTTLCLRFTIQLETTWKTAADENNSNSDQMKSGRIIIIMNKEWFCFFILIMQYPKQIKFMASLFSKTKTVHYRNMFKHIRPGHYTNATNETSSFPVCIKSAFGTYQPVNEYVSIPCSVCDIKIIWCNAHPKLYT